ncbi:hypothetical protein O4H56_21895, partial [Pseudomonas anguilliseptica]|nr:hypothetical protein [Pseudomonas anguilliseptica]
LIILRLTVLPHKHPHELLDSVVKERVVKSFVSTEARILQQPHLASSYFSKFFLEKFFLLNHLHYNLSALALIAQNFMLVLIVKPPTSFLIGGFGVGA